MELRTLQLQRKVSICGAYLQRGQAGHLTTLLTEKVWVIVSDGPASVIELIPPDSVPEIHPTNDSSTREIGQDTPYGGLIIDAHRRIAHDLLVGHGRPPLVERNQHCHALGGRTHALPLQEGPNLGLNMFERRSHGDVIQG